MKIRSVHTDDRICLTDVGSSMLHFDAVCGPRMNFAVLCTAGRCSGSCPNPVLPSPGSEGAFAFKKPLGRNVLAWEVIPRAVFTQAASQPVAQHLKPKQVGRKVLPGISRRIRPLSNFPRFP